MKAKKLKTGIAVAAAVIAAVLFIRMSGLWQGTKKNGGRNSTEKTVQPRHGSVINVLNLSGKILPYRMVEVKPTMSGEVQKLFFKAGDRVKEGEILAEIKPDPAVLVSLLQKEKNLWQARLDFTRKEKYYRDQKGLLDRHLISREEFEKTEQEYLLAEKTSKLAEMDLDIFRRQNGLPESESAELLNRNSLVRSPISGTILKVNLEPGTFVKSALSQYSEGTSIYTIGDLSRLTIKLAVPELNINQFAPGKNVTVTTESSEETDSGKVIQVSPMADLQSTPPTFDVLVGFSPQSGNFRPGMTGYVRLELERKDNVLVLPVQTVTGGNRFKFVIVKGEFGPETANVQTGISDNRFIEIVSGLDSSAAVYLNPLEMLDKTVRRRPMF